MFYFNIYWESKIYIVMCNFIRELEEYVVKERKYISEFFLCFLWGGDVVILFYLIGVMRK